MKKIVSLVAILTVFAMLLVGCAGKFDMDKSIEKLKDKGLTEDVLHHRGRMRTCNLAYKQ